MAFNGSGTYVLPGAALATGAVISSSEHNTFRSDVATALTTCITRDGQSPATANLPMGGNKLTGLAAATVNGDAVRFEQIPTASSLGLVIGTNVQAYSANLTTYATVAPTAAGLALLADEDAAAQRATLGLGTAATSASTAFAASGAVTGSGLTQSTAKMLGRSTAGTGAIEEISVGTGLSLSGGTLSATSTVASAQLCKAWVNFNGTLSGTITPRASYNIASVVKNGTGDYTITFTNAMADANYVIQGTGNANTSGGFGWFVSAPYNSAPSTTAFRIVTSGTAGTIGDLTYVMISVFGN